VAAPVLKGGPLFLAHSILRVKSPRGPLSAIAPGDAGQAKVLVADFAPHLGGVAGHCLLRVNRVSSSGRRARPLDPDDRTSSTLIGSSGMCQERTLRMNRHTTTTSYNPPHLS
jgi:hypothetical protein